MIPISDDNPTLRTPVMTYVLLGLIALVWIIKLFENRNYTAQRTGWRHRLHPDHP